MTLQCKTRQGITVPASSVGHTSVFNFCLCCIAEDGARSSEEASARGSALTFAPSFASSSADQEPAANGVAQAVNRTRQSLHRLSTDPDITIDVLHAAHQYMQAKDQDRELQVLT